MLRATWLLVLIAACWLAAALPAEAKTYGLATSRGFVVKLGPLHVRDHPHLQDAIDVFGRPSSIKPVPGACKASWPRLGLKATFTSFAAITDFCADGLFQTATVRSPIWRTWAGLRVGMRSSRVRELHHSAVFTSGKWVLRTQDVIGSGPSPTVSALVSGGRVLALSLWVGAAGD